MSIVGEEKWRDIEGFEGLYAISDLGRVKSLARRVWRKGSAINPSGNYCPIRERILSACKSGAPYGYFQVTLWRDHVASIRTVHSLVMDAFLGPKPQGMERCHNDGKTSNNALSNLRYDTPIGNARDRVQHGTHVCGSKVGVSKLNEGDIPFIREALAAGESPTALANRFALKSTRAIHRIRRGEGWMHVP